MDLSNEVHHRTMRDFLELYNKLTHHCFEKCISNFNHRIVSPDEGHCVNFCAEKFITFNQRHMLSFMEFQQNKQKRAALAAESAAALTAVSANETGPLDSLTTSSVMMQPPSSESDMLKNVSKSAT